MAIRFSRSKTCLTGPGFLVQFRDRPTPNADSLVSRIKLVAQHLGLPADDYSGHSLRAGGATDLFIARVLYLIIKQMGRWSSDAATVYYRHDEDVIREVSTAFQLVANPTPTCRGSL